MKLTESNLLRHWLTAVLLGEAPSFKLNGTAEQLNAVSEALLMTQLFDREVANEGATVESVMEALDRKHRSVQRFERLFGKTWPL